MRDLDALLPALPPLKRVAVAGSTRRATANGSNSSAMAVVAVTTREDHHP